MLFSSVFPGTMNEDEQGFSALSTKINYDDFPGLPDLLLDLLSTEDDVRGNQPPKIEADIEQIYLALDFLLRAGPPDNYKTQILNQIMYHFGSENWQMREASARLYSALLRDREEWLAPVEKLLECKPTSTNQSHGVLLAVGYILEHHLAVGVDPLSALGKPLVSFYHCPKHSVPLLKSSNLTNDL
jgi:hypothetical protein